MANSLLDVLANRILIADGAMGTMLQAADLTLDDFDGHEGCNEILNVTRPDVVRCGARRLLRRRRRTAWRPTLSVPICPTCASTASQQRICELSEAGARLAREAADACRDAGPPRFVLGSIGPGTKLPTLGHVTVRDAARRVPGERGRADRRRRRRA